VKDQSGAVLPGASVTVTDSGTGSARTTTSGADGGYVVESLKPGEYEITAGLEGFKETTITGISVQVAQRARVDVTLEVGVASDRVDVVATSPVIQTDSASVGQVIGSREALELPLDGRQFIQLATLAPGVVSSGGSVTGGGISANGMSYQSNNLMIDGILNWETAEGRQNFSPSLDMIQEFKIQTNSYDAEYGLTGGAQVNVITKRGTKAYHGSGFYFGRDDAFDARPLFQPGELPPFSQKEFGGTVGGRIPGSEKDFFFLSYQGFRQAKGLTLVRTFPTDALRRGDFSGVSTTIYDPRTYDPATGQRLPFPGNIIPSDRISPVSAAFMPFWPPVAAGAPLANNFVSNPNERFDRNEISIRYDRDLSAKDALTFRFTYSVLEVELPLGNCDCATGVPGLGEFGNFNGTNSKLNWTHIFSGTTLNTLNVGFSRFLQDRQNETTGTDYMTPAGIAGITRLQDGIPTFNLSGWTPISDNFDSPSRQTFENYVIENILTTIRGRHSLKFGAGLVNNRGRSSLSTFDRPTFNFDPRYSTASANAPGNQFNALADFLLGTPSSASVWNNRVEQDLRGKWIHAFAQDNWTPLQSLTLTYGLRYEIFSVPYDAQNRLSAIDLGTGRRVYPGEVPQMPGVPANAVTAESLGYPRNLQFPTSYTNFVPRLGFAYRIGGSHDWVVRGGFGVFNNWVNATAQINTAIGPPWVPQFRVICNADVPCIDMTNPFATTAVPATAGSAASKTNRLPSVRQYSLGLAYQVTPTFGTEVSYVGNSNRHNLMRLDLNQPAPGSGPINDRLPFPQFSTLRSPLSIGRSNYNALQVTARKLYDATGLTFMGSYTWANALGTAPSSPEINEFQPIRDVRDFENDYGPTSYDLRHIHSFSWSYELPIGHGKPIASHVSSAINQVISGWRLGGIVSGRSGRPLTVSDVVNTSNAGGSRPDLVCEPNDHRRENQQAAIQQWFNTSCFARAAAFTFGNAGVGVVRGPGHHNVDLSLQKGIAIGAGRRLELRVDVFNAFNRAHLGNPSTAFGTAGFGTISDTIGTARQMQLGARFEF
ncbi:MAG: carboxypeptidase regulatory-like domain-containing protein, partial [Vicinamibacteraceae bacterium]